MTECPYCFDCTSDPRCCTSGELAAENKRLRKELDEVTSECAKLGMAGGLMQSERDDAAERARQWERTANEERARADVAEADNKLLRIHRDTKEAIIDKLIAENKRLYEALASWVR